AATDDSSAIPKHTTVETPMNMSPINKAHFESEKEVIHLILTGIRDEIYSTVDACQTAQEMWEAIKRLQQGKSLNIQDVKTNLFWEFSNFTSHDGETMESYYTRFYKLMNEMIQNNLIVAMMQVNVQFLQQLQPEWSRFVMIVKQQHNLDEVSYHKLFDILKQYQEEVNELCAERLAKNANPLALVATAQANQDPYYQTSKSQKSYAPSSKPSIPTRSYTTTRYKGKEIAKPITPPSESAFEEDNDPKQAQRDKDMQKNLALIAKYFKRIYKPTNNNLRTSSNSRNKNVDTTPRYMAKIQEVPTADLGTDFEPLEQVQNDTGYNVFSNKLPHSEQSESISNTCLVETDDSNVIPDSPDMCDDDIQNDNNDVEINDEHKQTEFEKYKAFNDRTIDYDKLKCKINETLGQLAQKDTEIKEGLKLKPYEILVVKEKHDELIKQSLLTKSHYKGLVKQKTKVKHIKDQFRAPTAKDIEILIQTCLMPLSLKTQNDSFISVHELKQEMLADLKYVESLEKEIDELEFDKAEFSNMYDMILQECVSNEVMCSYLILLSDLDALTELQCLYLHKVKECDSLAQKLSKQTESVSKEVHTKLS
nr:hypothetical protein [Tanacetum cinerariifolium]